MIEEIVRAWLAGRLSVPVYLEVPERPPQAFVVLEKTGGSKIDHIRRATLALQSYAGRLTDAARLNERVKAAMEDMPDLDEVCRAALNSDYNFTDTQSKKYRYQAVYDITYY